MTSPEILLIGVTHHFYFWDGVIDFLKQERIKDRKVMLELAKNRVPSQPSTDGLTFFEELGDFVIKEGGKLIYGEDEEILERTYARNKELYGQMRKPGISVMEWAELYCENTFHLPFMERDPHFLKVFQEQAPDIVVLGRSHIPYLVKNYHSMYPLREVYIPTE